MTPLEGRVSNASTPKHVVERVLAGVAPSSCAAGAVLVRVCLDEIIYQAAQWCVCVAVWLLSSITPAAFQSVSVQ